MALVDWVCPKCGAKRREQDSIREMAHPCPAIRGGKGRSRFVEMVRAEEDAA
jgi:hypothetical protein